MNEVASPCCGSCAWYCWNGRLLKHNCHNPEIIKQHKQNTIGVESLCLPSYYFPREPIPLINVPRVKKLVEACKDMLDICLFTEGTIVKSAILTNRTATLMKKQLESAIAKVEAGNE